MKNHAVYGDDDIIRLEKIFKEKEEIQQLVDASNRQLMKERLKTTSKKKSIDPTTNATVVKEAPPEVDAKQRIPKKPEEEIKKEEKQKKEKKIKKEKKKQGQHTAKKIAILFIALILLLVVLAFKNDIYQGIQGLIPNDIRNPIIENNDVETKLKNVLYSATNSNEQLKTHYKNLSDLVENSDTTISQSSLNALRDQVKTDKNTFMSHSAEFTSYSGGGDYYNSILSRFINLENSIDQIGTIDNIRDARNMASQAISYENQLIETDKEVLKNFLDKNGIAYTEKANSISFDI